MTRTTRHSRILIALSLIAAFAWPDARLTAAQMLSYDLDSLVYLSTEIVEGEITRSTYGGPGDGRIDVKVTHVHYGNFIKNQIIAVAYTESYRKAKEEKKGLQMLSFAVGDNCIFFLQCEHRTESVRRPGDPIRYAPISSGLKLFDDGHVHGFLQGGNPGPYMSVGCSEPDNSKLNTIDEYREMITKSLRDTEEWSRLIEDKLDKLDWPRLVKLLESRPKPTGPRNHSRDYFAERIYTRLAESHDPELLGRALPLAKRYMEFRIVEAGFGSPKGRDYLLSKVLDESLPPADRVRFSYALRNAGAVYFSTSDGFSGNFFLGSEKEADKGNGGYLTRMAKAAFATAKQQDLSMTLIECLAQIGQDVVQYNFKTLQSDLDGAFRVLQKMYETKPSEQLQFQIEHALACDRVAYEKLKSPCGSFICLAKAVDASRYGKPEKRSLYLECWYNSTLLSSDAKPSPTLVLIHEGSKEMYLLASRVKIRSTRLDWPTDLVELPKDLPPGKYRVFYQVTDGDKVISSGHHFIADL